MPPIKLNITPTSASVISLIREVEHHNQLEEKGAEQDKCHIAGISDGFSSFFISRKASSSAYSTSSLELRVRAVAFVAADQL